MKMTTVLSAILLLGALATPIVQAATVVSNAGNSPGPSLYEIGTSVFAVSFTTGSGSDWILREGTMTLDFGSSGQVAGFQASIWTHNVDQPGTKLYSSAFTNLFSTGDTNVTFNFTGITATVAANTTYWLAVEAPQGTPDVRPTEDLTSSGSPGWSIGDVTRINVNPGVDSIFDTILADQALRISLDAVAVPEPSNLALLSLGGLALLRRRRQAA